mmetsp:Transcript_20636/g.65852  ORF Transcript_20636/g.65852 Transcript_20636/m.65852 type:complete len:240 (+) Transcript_20636:529-1248(+)
MYRAGAPKLTDTRIPILAEAQCRKVLQETAKTPERAAKTALSEAQRLQALAERLREAEELVDSSSGAAALVSSASGSRGAMSKRNSTKTLRTSRDWPRLASAGGMTWPPRPEKSSSAPKPPQRRHAARRHSSHLHVPRHSALDISFPAPSQSICGKKGFTELESQNDGRGNSASQSSSGTGRERISSLAGALESCIELLLLGTRVEATLVLAAHTTRAHERTSKVNRVLAGFDTIGSGD